MLQVEEIELPSKDVYLSDEKIQDLEMKGVVHTMSEAERKRQELLKKTSPSPATKPVQQFKMVSKEDRIKWQMNKLLSKRFKTQTYLGGFGSRSTSAGMIKILCEFLLDYVIIQIRWPPASKLRVLFPKCFFTCIQRFGYFCIFLLLFLITLSHLRLLNIEG